MSGHKHVDVLIVGAGLSGIGAAHHVQQRFPHRSYALLEARDTIGGTWDLFRYPGVRSDSDMHTLGYRFRPWTDGKSIADGPAILDYIRGAAADAGIVDRVRFGHQVIGAAWSSESATWTVSVNAGDTPTTLTCSMLLMCSGYYNYEHGFTPEFPHLEDYAGPVIHPQFWPQDLDHAHKRIVVVGSGATAITLLPALAATAAHVTMLQRSPTYVMTVPAHDRIASTLKRLLGTRCSYSLTRWKNVLSTWALYELSRRRPDWVKAMVRRGLRDQLPEDFDIDTHFTPKYDPWDQRLCAAPDGDLFKALGTGRAEVVTDTIDRFTRDGIKLASGRLLEADIVVTATGLDLLLFGGIDIVVDDIPVNVAETFAYKGMMLSGVPNFVFTLGYTNASWTLKADLVSQYVCRLLEHLDSEGHDYCVPIVSRRDMERRPLFDFDAGYVVRAQGRLPHCGPTRPWRLGQNYIQDVFTLRHRPVDDEVLHFGGAGHH